MIVIQPDCLLAKLGGKGFQLAYSDDETHEMLFVRKRNDELFERIRIGFGTQERVGDLVCAGVECSIVPGRTGLKGMTEYVCLTECATDPASGWSTLADEQDISNWVDALSACAPGRAAELARDVGPTISQRTQDARNAAEEYFLECKRLGSVSQALQSLRATATEAQLIYTRQITSCPVAVIPNGVDYYELAALAISVFSAQVEGDASWLDHIGVGSTEDSGLMVRIQVLASKLAEEPGWDLDLRGAGGHGRP